MMSPIPSPYGFQKQLYEIAKKTEFLKEGGRNLVPIPLYKNRNYINVINKIYIKICWRHFWRQLVADFQGGG
jgi:predicted  nucleic acid-binding Zn ribbon protein